MLSEEIERACYPFSQPQANVQKIRDCLMDTMWQDVGVMRDESGITRGIEQINDIRDELMHTGVADGNRAFNLAWHDWMNLQSLVDVSLVIAKAALWRENSRGAHFREDYPDEGNMPDSYFTVVRMADEHIEVRREPVVFSRVKPGESLIESG